MKNLTKNKNFISILPNRIEINKLKELDKKEVTINLLNGNFIGYGLSVEEKEKLQIIANIFINKLKNNHLDVNGYLKVKSKIASIPQSQLMSYIDVVINLLEKEKYNILEEIKEVDKRYLSFADKIAIKVASDIKNYDVVKDLSKEKEFKEMLDYLYDERFKYLENNEDTKKIYLINKDNFENLVNKCLTLFVKKYHFDKVSYDPHYRNALYKVKTRTRVNWQK